MWERGKNGYKRKEYDVGVFKWGKGNKDKMTNGRLDNYLSPDFQMNNKDICFSERNGKWQ